LVPALPTCRALATIFRKYGDAARRGDFDAVGTFLPAAKAKKQKEALAKIQDEKVMLERRKNLQSMGSAYGPTSLGGFET